MLHSSLFISILSVQYEVGLQLSISLSCSDHFKLIFHIFQVQYKMALELSLPLSCSDHFKLIIDIFQVCDLCYLHYLLGNRQYVDCCCAAREFKKIRVQKLLNSMKLLLRYVKPKNMNFFGTRINSSGCICAYTD